MTRKIGYAIGKAKVGSHQLSPREQSSECVRELEYDPEHQQMIVHFWKRGSYAYFDVDYTVYAEFNQSSKRGTYYNLYIRDRYSYQRIS